MEFDPFDERGRVAEHRRNPVANARRRPGRASRRDLSHEHAIHPTPDIRRDSFDAATDFGRTLGGLPLGGALEGDDLGPIRKERHGAQRQHREEQERDDEAGAE
jgi:hypothetical protein